MQFTEPGWEPTDSPDLLVRSSGPGVHLLGWPQLLPQPPHPAALITFNFPSMGLGWLQSPPHHTHTHTHTHTHFPTQSETDWLLGVPFVATGRSKKPAVDRKERVCLHLGLILGWDPLQETLRRSWGTGLQSECAGESPGDMVQMKVRVGFWAGA